MKKKLISVSIISAFTLAFATGCTTQEKDGRITRLTFEIDDTPGQLADISRIIGEAGANVIEVIHQRMMQSVSLKQAELEVVIEARDISHVEDIVGALRARGFRLTTDSAPYQAAKRNKE